MSLPNPGPQDIGIFLSGGTNNTNPNKSIGGAISNTRITFSQGSKTFNNLWSDVSERQRRYGFKDIRIIYLKNMNSTLTFKNARVYWNKTDNFTSIQAGRAPVNGVENAVATVAALLPTSDPIPPSMWHAIKAAEAFRVVQDFNTSTPTFGRFVGTPNNGPGRGVYIVDSSSAMFNQKIARITFILRRRGNPSPPLNCRIWDTTPEHNIKAEMGSVDPAIIPEDGANQITFTNQNNDYAMQAGDVIGIRYNAGPDEDDPAPSDDNFILMGVADWTGEDPNWPPSNVQFDVIGTEEWSFNGGGRPNQWLRVQDGQSEVCYKAEIFGEPAPGGGDPCNPDPGPGDPGDPGNPPPTGGFVIIQDFSDVNATTGYQVGNGPPNNIFRRAVAIDNTTATILSAPIARITFLMRRVGNATGNITCRIWNNAGTVMATMGTLPVSGLTTQTPGWTQVPFTLQTNAYQMKVGDLIGVEYTTGTVEDHILLAGWQWNTAAAASITAEAEGGQVAAANDKFGVRMIYGNNGAFRYDWEIPSNSDSMRWDLPNPPINMEMTGYFMKSSPSSDTISCKIRGGKHNDSVPNDGCCYIPQFPCTGGSMEFQIECPHPNNHDCSISGTSGTSTSLAQWHGYKIVVWNEGSVVHIEGYNDTGDNSGSTPTNTWVKVFSHIDSSGSCGNIGSQLLKPKGSSSQATFRIDSNSGVQGKWLSAVEIQPGGVQPPPPGGGTPPAPGAKDVPGTSIRRWNGTVWTADDSGLSDLVFRAERFSTTPGEPPPEEDPVLTDPGTKRKPTSYDQGIVIPPLNPGQHTALILERIFPPKSDAIPTEEEEQQLIIEIDTTTEPSQPTDPGQPPPTVPCPPSQPPPTTPPPTTPPPTIPPGQVGPYASTGQQLGATTRRGTRHYASGKPDDETIEKNTDNIPYDHYQCVYYVTMHAVEHDDTVSVKYGGTHMGTGWFDHGISFNQGQTCMGKEEEHPSTDLCVITGPSYGSILEKRIGIAGIYRRPTNYCELWIRLPNAAWVKAIQATDVGGFDPGSSEDEAQLRIDGFEDGSDPTIDVAMVQEIAPA